MILIGFRSTDFEFETKNYQIKNRELLLPFHTNQSVFYILDPPFFIFLFLLQIC